jgi:mRNA-degrading endonuclease RelE of RelBE toxin-antitoxin system
MEKENEIYIASQVADKLKSLSPSSRDTATALISSLSGSGWQNSQIIVPDADSPGGGLRSVISGNIRLFFRYAPEQHAIIVADVASIYERELSAIA